MVKKIFNKISGIISSPVSSYCFYFACFLPVIASLVLGINVLLILSLLFSLFFIIFSNKRIIAFFGLMPLSLFMNLKILSFSINVFHITTLVLFIILIIELFVTIKSKKNIVLQYVDRIVFLVPTLYGVLVLLINSVCGVVLYQRSFSNELISWFRDSLYLVFPFVFLALTLLSNKKKDVFDYCFYFLVTFTVASFVAFLVYMRNPLLLYNDEEELLNITTKRFNGFDFDPNFFSLYAIFFNLIFLRLKPDFSIKYFVWIFCIGVLNFLSLFSGSKMFLVCLVLFAVALSLKLYFKNKTIFYFVCFLFILLIVIFLLSYGNVVIDYIDKRIINNGAKSYGGGFLSSISTGRTIIFADYSDYILQHLPTFIFGINLGDKLIDLHAVHNTFAYTIYNYGFFVGSLQLYSVYKCFYSKIIPNNSFKVIYILSLLLCLNSLNFYFSLNAISLFAILLSVQPLPKERKKTNDIICITV